MVRQVCRNRRGQRMRRALAISALCDYDDAKTVTIGKIYAERERY